LNTYFHYWLTCPYCHEPHIKSNFYKPLKNVSDYIQCRNSHCRANFNQKMKIPPSINKNKDLKKVIENIPLCWEIIPNPIEQSYLEWIKENDINKNTFLITWPWDEVKFIPLIIQEFIHYKKPQNPIVIFSKNIREGHALEGKKSPAHNILQKCLLTHYRDNNEKNIIMLDEHTKRDLFSAIDNMHKTRDLHLVEYKIDGEKITRHTARKLGNSELPNGAEVTFRHRVRFKGTLKYNKDWMAFIISRHQNIEKQNTRKIIEIFSIDDFPNEKISDDKILFIKTRNDTCPNKTLLETKFDNPSLVIIDNLEFFLRYYRKDDFLDFLNNLNDDTIVLLFSTTPGKRYLHMDFIENYKEKINFHCWDTENRVNWIKINENDAKMKEKYPSPGTSDFNEEREYI
jgi:hypothetical protein